MSHSTSKQLLNCWYFKPPFLVPKGCPVRLCHNRLQGSYFEETPAISLKHAQAPSFRLGFSVFLFVWSASRKVGWKNGGVSKKHTTYSHPKEGPELPWRFTILGFCNQLFWKPWSLKTPRAEASHPRNLTWDFCCWFGSQKKMLFWGYECLLLRVVDDAGVEASLHLSVLFDTWKPLITLHLQ